MCDNCPASTCSPATKKAARRAKHPGNPKVRVYPADAQHLRIRAKAQGVTTAEATRDIVDLALASEGLRRTAEDHRQEAARQRSSALAMAEERNRLAARLARLCRLSESVRCNVAPGASGHVAWLPDYPEVRATDADPAQARLEVAVQAANYLPGLVTAALRERSTARTAAEEAGAKLADERQAHAATAAALAACNARVETLTVSLKIADNRSANQASSLADAARRIQAQMEALEQRDERLTSQTWTIGGLAISTLIALLGLALVVA